jgi:16S rRNA (cytosine967-C5)-methyltransferase
MGRAVDARALALQVLLDVERQAAYLNVALSNALFSAGVADSRDTGLATELSYGVYRRLLSLDAALQPVVDRPLGKLETAVLCLLRMGAYQILYLDRIPPHAAVSETVRLAKAAHLERASGFINAVLRSLAKNPQVPLPPVSKLVEHLSIRESHPRWLVQEWVTQLGPEEAEALCKANNQAPSVQIRCNLRRATRDAVEAALKEEGVASTPTRYAPEGLTLQEPGRMERLGSFKAGLWQIQDEAAQCVGAMADPGRAERVLDACAAPGGKACHLLQRLSPLARLLATDLHQNKLRKIQEEATRLGLEGALEVRQGDATLPFTDAPFDLALLDAPCTGLGTLRRHPELRYRRMPGDDTRLAELQGALIRNVARALRPGGRMIYSVCSTSPREGVEVVESFLRGNRAFSRASIEAPASVRPLLDARGDLATWPHRHGTDGFYAAVVQRG